MPVNRDRAAVVAAAIAAQARSAGEPVALVHVCRAAVELLSAAATGVLMLSDYSGAYEPVQVHGLLGEKLTELQVTYGEGPGVTALAQDRPVLVPDLAAGGTGRRWPMLVPAALQLGARAAFAFPLLAGRLAVGTLEIWRETPGWLSDEQAADALLLADAALTQLLAQLHAPQQHLALPPYADGPEAFMDRWPQVHQATGMVSVQLGTNLTTAFLRLRAHAFAHGTANGHSLRQAAEAVVDGRLSFASDPDPPPGARPGPGPGGTAPDL
ncbi:GAF and ANTAR domain-containing protein [Actinomadura hibisca]|uniref:GAF and ANTAR domain-containing protein n=1 Tax=Actinomadura hibisca TaxID=68565 RepID=UPI000831C6FB|nr:GAF and ANTAR domain-containing protein [Actinomadura hibisca]